MPVLILSYFIIGKHLRGPINEFHGDNCFCPVDQGEGSLPCSSVWCRSEGPKNYRQLLDPPHVMLLHHIKGSHLESMQYFSVCPLSLTIASWVSNGSETDFAAEVLDILHEGAACELCADVGDDPVGYTKTAH